MRYLVLTCVMSLGMLVSPNIDAQTTGADRTRAQEAFERGLALVEEENFEAALAAFDESLRLFPTQTALFNRALCLGFMGRPAEAIEALEEHLRTYGATVDASRRSEVEQQLERQRLRVGRIAVQVDGAEGAGVSLNGQQVGSVPLDRPLVVNPGRHQVTIQPQDGEPVSRWVTVGAGGEVSVVVALGASQPSTGSILVSVDVAGAEVRLDDTVVGQAPLAGPIPATPGQHVVSVAAEGHEPSRAEVQVRAGEQSRVDLVMVPQAEQAPAVEARAGRRGLRVGAYVTSAVAVVALGAALGVYLWGNGQYDTWQTEDTAIREALGSSEPMDVQELDARIDDNNALLESIQGADAATIALLAAGSAVAVGAVVLFILGFRGDGNDEGEASLSLLPTPGGMSLAGRW